MRAMIKPALGTFTMRTTALAIILAMLVPLPARAAPAGAAGTAAFKQQMLNDTIAAVQRSHEGFARAVSRGALKPNRGYAYTLAASVNLHAATGDAQFLAWAQADIVALVEAARAPDGKHPSSTGFATWCRFAKPICICRRRARSNPGSAG